MSAPRPERRRDTLAALLLVAVVAIVFSDVLSGTGGLYIRDLWRYHYPMKQIVRSVVLSGEFPWWNPYYAAGQPMAANPAYEIFYPLQWLIFLPNFDFGFQLHILIHFVLAIVGTFVLLRSFRVGRSGALFGAISLALGGCYLSLSNLLPSFFCAAWMPLIFYFARRFLVLRSKRDFACAALAAGVQSLVGEPVTLIQTWAIVGVWAGWRALRRPRRVRRLQDATLLMLLLLVATLAVGAVQLVPALDHARDSNRARPISYEAAGSRSFPAARLAELVIPDIFGRTSLNAYWAGRRLYPEERGTYIFSLYFGLLGSILAMAGLMRRRPGRPFVVAVGAASLVLAAGPRTPLFHILYESGIASRIRYPEKWMVAAVVVLTFYAAAEFDRCARGDPATIRNAKRIALIVLLFSSALAVTALTPFYAARFESLWLLPGGDWPRNWVSLSRFFLVLAVVRAMIVAGLFYWRSKMRTAGGWVIVATLFTAVDLWWLSRDVSPRMPSEFFTPPPATQQLSADRDQYRVFNVEAWDSRARFAGGQRPVDDPDDSSGARTWYADNPLPVQTWILRAGLAPMSEGSWGYRSVLSADYDRTDLLPTVDLVESMWKVRRSGRKDWDRTFMAMSNAWYRTGALRPMKPELERVDRVLSKVVPIDFVRVTSAPRYYFSDHIVSIRDQREFVQRLISERHRPKVAFVEGPAFEPAGGRVLRVDEASSRIMIDAEAEGQALLVMSVTPHKYWSATIDGVDAELVDVNIGYQGIALGRGRHRVEMRYRNPLVAWAGGVSLLAVLALTTMALTRRRRSPVR